MKFSSSVRTPCPICGRTSSGCRSRDELLFCRIGHTFNPFTRHSDLKIGDVVGDWACVAINEDDECVTFKVHEERVQTNFRRWEYFSTSGRRVFHNRTDFSVGKKEMSWSTGAKPNELLPLWYESLPESGATVFVVEGETCAESLRALGLWVTSVPNGSSSWRSKMPDMPKLRDNQLILCPDRDRPGVELMQRIAEAFPGSKWLLPQKTNSPAWQSPDDGYDIADWIADGADIEALRGAVQLQGPELPKAPWWDRLDFGCDKLTTLAPFDVTLKLSEQLGDCLRWNQLYQAIELDGVRPDDEDVRNMYIDFGRLNVKIEKYQAIDFLIYSARQRQYHPVKDYLDSCNDPLPDDMWQNVGGEFLGGHPEEFDNSIVRRWLVHAVRRIYEPGSPFGILLVLVGKQEAGKSRFFEELASKDWFNDGFKLTGSEADDIQKLTQTWIAEWGELDGGLKKSNEADIKAFISRKVDRTREAYGQGTCRRDRSFVMCGTTNKESGFFSDETGNRRFALYNIGDNDIDGEKVAKWRDRIWASAKRAYLAGMSIHLNEDERAIQRERNRLMFREDPWIGKISTYLGENLHKDFVTVDELLTNEYCLDIEIGRVTKFDSDRVRTALVAIGWLPKRRLVQGHYKRGYQRPSDLSSDI